MNAPNSVFWQGRLISRSPVKEISLAYIFNLALDLEEINELPDVGGVNPVMFQLWNIETTLRVLLEDSVFSSHFRSSRPLGVRLLNSIKECTFSTEERQDQKFFTGPIKVLYRDYKIALQAELDSFYSYFVTRKKGYDTFSLIKQAEVLFSEELNTKVPEAIFDLQEAGRCLAFERFTATGFHLFRAVESIVRRYWAQMSGGKAPPKVRSLGVYIAALEQAKVGDPKVVAALRQLNTLHRNPLAHPEVVLTLDEAIAILGPAQSLIGCMLAGLPLIKPTTSQTPLL